MYNNQSAIRNPHSAINPLKALCNRMGISVPTQNPVAEDVITIVQKRLAEHLRSEAQLGCDTSGDYVQWKQIKEALEQFLTELEAMPKPTAPEPPRIISAPSFPPSFPSLASVKSPSDSPEPKADQNRTTSGPPSQPLQNEHNDLDQNRTKSGAKPDQKRGKTGPLSENPSKSAKNSDEEPDQSGPPQKTEPPKFDHTLAREKIGKMNLTQTIQFAVKEGLLPDPEKEIDINKYISAFVDLFGPPIPVRLDAISSEQRAVILAVLENYSERKAEAKLMLPPPFGPYLRTSKSSLHRFIVAEQAREAEQNQRAIKKHISHILNQPTVNDSDYTALAEKLLNTRLVEAALNPRHELAQTKTLVDMTEKIRAGKLAERKLDLAQSKP